MEFGPNGFKLGSMRELCRRKECPFCQRFIQSLRRQLIKLSSQSGDRDHDIDISNLNIDDWPKRESIGYASWQVDGRMLKRESEGILIGSRACTRRIRLHWNTPAVEDAYIVLMAAPTRESPGLSLGRFLQSAGSTLPRIRQWTEACVKFHGPTCQQKSHDLIKWKSFFGVINVEELVALPAGAKYAALTYVWGKGRVFTTKIENIRASQAREG